MEEVVEDEDEEKVEDVIKVELEVEVKEVEVEVCKLVLSFMYSIQPLYFHPLLHCWK